MTTTITREQYEAGITAAYDKYFARTSTSMPTMPSAINAFLAAVDIRVERTPAEQIAAIAAFVADIGGRSVREIGCRTLENLVLHHFPEVSHRD